jgi:hypothetical protein
VNIGALLRTVALGTVWLVLVALLALGAAGIVASMNHMPGSGGRPELMWTADEAAKPALDAATDQLQALSDQVDQLSATARQALTAVTAGDVSALSTTIAAGTQQIGGVSGQGTRLDEALGAVPGAGSTPELALSPEVIHRYQALAATHGLTDSLGADWTSFSGRALNAATLTNLLARHDRETVAAAAQGSAAHYQPALTILDTADATIAQTRTARDALAATTDVSTLSTWIDRNAAYDGALRRLYQALLSSKGRVTDKVRAAFTAEQAARGQLPPDTRGLVVIMSDIAQGGLNQAVISIEKARGEIGKALDLQHQLQQGPALPG